MRLIVCLFGVLLLCVAHAAEVPEPAFTVSRYAITGPNPLDPQATDDVVAPFLGDHIGMEGLFAARDALRSLLRRNGHTFVDVIVPPQTLDGGTVTLEIVPIALGAIRVVGNEHFTEASVRRSLPALDGESTPDLRELSRQLAVANQHPAKQLKLNFSSSADTEGAVDAEVKVDDTRPWAIFTGVNNIGTESTGHTRWTVGAEYSDLTGHDDVLSGSFTTSPDNADDVRQYAAFYQLPIYRARGWFTAFYVNSDVDVGNVQGLFDISGAGEFIGLSFRHTLRGSGRYRHSLTVGLQDRLFDTAVSDTATGALFVPFSSKVRSRPLSLRYDGGYNWSATSLDFYFDFTQNLSFGGHNNKRAYAAVRGPADPAWKLVRFGALVTQRLPRGLMGVAKVTGQYTNEPLIPGEQIGFGGDRIVRGFEIRTISADKGVQFNVELWSPPLRDFHGMNLYGLRLLAFVDAAHKVLEKPLPGQRRKDTISSVGVGARWQWGRRLTALLDYGQPLANADGEASDRGNSKVHFNLEFRY